MSSIDYNCQEKINDSSPKPYFYKCSLDSTCSSTLFSTTTLSSNINNDNDNSKYKNSSNDKNNDPKNSLEYAKPPNNFHDLHNNYEFYPQILHLPQSMKNQNDLSWGLWNWIHSQDFVQQESVYKDSQPTDLGTLGYTHVFTKDNSELSMKPRYHHHVKHTHLKRGDLPPEEENVNLSSISSTISNCLNQHISMNNSNNNSNNEGKAAPSLDVTLIDEMMGKGGTIDLKNQIG